jgi:hypothetical protein
MTDGWSAYRGLSRHGYTHHVVIHERNFLNPVDKNVHTQSIEGHWSVIKRKLRKKGTNLKAYLYEHLCEIIFKREFSMDVFTKMLDLIKAKHPFSI